MKQAGHRPRPPGAVRGFNMLRTPRKYTRWFSGVIAFTTRHLSTATDAMHDASDVNSPDTDRAPGTSARPVGPTCYALHENTRARKGGKGWCADRHGYCRPLNLRSAHRMRKNSRQDPKSVKANHGFLILVPPTFVLSVGATSQLRGKGFTHWVTRCRLLR